MRVENTQYFELHWLSAWMRDHFPKEMEGLQSKP